MRFASKKNLIKSTITPFILNTPKQQLQINLQLSCTNINDNFLRFFYNIDYKIICKQLAQFKICVKFHLQ